MKTSRLLSSLFTLLLIVAISLTACSSPPTGTLDQPARPGPAEIDSVEVLRLANPPDQLRVIARGFLPTGCLALDEPGIRQVNNTFAVTLNFSPLAETGCAAVRLPFEKVISLEIDGLHGGTYVVTVNGVTEVFDLPSATSAVVAVEPGSSGANPEEAGSGKTGSENETKETQPAGGPGESPGEPGADTASTSSPPIIPPSSPVAPVDLSQSKSSDPSCTNKAALYAENIAPSQPAFRQGEALVKGWRLRNEGDCTWDEGYSLVFVEGDLMNGPSPFFLPNRVAPGELIDLSLNLNAPTEGGDRYGLWLLSDAQGRVFGTGINASDGLFVRIAVSWYAPEGVPVQASGSCQIERNPGYEAELLALINNFRISRGLTPLALQNQLAQAAAAHSTDMACHDFSTHEGTDRSNWFGRIQSQGYAYSYASENIYNGDPTYGGTPLGALDFWSKSQVHFDNMTNPDVTEVGIGFVLFPERKAVDRTYSGYYTVVFASP